MVVKELKELFERNHEVRFKLYSLEYVIKEMDNKILFIQYCMKQRKASIIHLKML